MVSAFTHWIKVLLAYIRDGEDGLADLEEELRSEASDQPEGKITKSSAAYLPQAPFLPMLWRQRCGRCRFWHEGERGQPAQCHIVGREDDRSGGEAIHFRAWCAFWMPPREEPAFGWLKERLRPEGRESVRGRWDPETAVKERHRKADAEAQIQAPEPVAPPAEVGTDGE